MRLNSFRRIFFVSIFAVRYLRLHLEHRWRLSIAQASLALRSAYAIFEMLIQRTHQ